MLRELEAKVTKKWRDQAKKKEEECKLLTPVILDYMQKAFEMGQPFRMHPFKWNRETRRPEYVKSKWSLLMWYFNIFITFAYSVFVVVRCIQTAKNPNAKKSEKVYMQFITVYFIYPSVMNLAVFLHGKELPQFVNEYANFFDMFERKYCGGLKKKPWMVSVSEFLMGNIYRNTNCITVLVVISMYFSPASPEHLTSLAADPQSLSFLKKLPFLCFLGYIEIINHTHCFFLIFVEFGFIFPALIIINELSSKNCKITLSSLRASDDKFRIYNTCKILLGLYNEIYSSFLTPATKVYLVTVIVMSVYGSIRLSGIVAITIGAIGLLCFSFTLIAFSTFAEFQGRSAVVLDTWRTWHVYGSGAKKDKWNRMVLRSMTPMKVVLRSCYCVDREMVLTMVQSISVESANFLLANS